MAPVFNVNKYLLKLLIISFKLSSYLLIIKDDRLKIFKDVKKRGEEHKISIRQARRNYNSFIKICIKDNNLPSNLEKINLKIVQKLTDEATKKIDSIIGIKKNGIINI